jgi:hypothetical protein
MFCVKWCIEGRADELLAHACVSDGCREWDDMSGGARHFESHGGGFFVGFYVVQFREGEVFLFFDKVLVSLHIVSL